MPEKKAAEAILEESARELAENLDEKDREPFVKDYVEVLMKLNDNLDDILADFREDASTVVSAFVQSNPRVVKLVVDKHAQDLSELMRAFSMMISRVGDEATRALMTKAARKGIVTCSKSIRDLADRNEKRKGVELS